MRSMPNFQSIYKKIVGIDKNFALSPLTHHTERASFKSQDKVISYYKIQGFSHFGRFIDNRITYWIRRYHFSNIVWSGFGFTILNIKLTQKARFTFLEICVLVASYEEYKK